MEYNGIELKEFASDKPIAFDPPRKMVVWNDSSGDLITSVIYAYLPGLSCPVVTRGVRFQHCAEIQEEPTSRRATNRELSRWLARGNGEVSHRDETSLDEKLYAHVDYFYEPDVGEEPTPEEYHVRKWEDSEWHEPTTDYMGLEG